MAEPKQNSRASLMVPERTKQVATSLAMAMNRRQYEVVEQAVEEMALRLLPSLPDSRAGFVRECLARPKPNR